ncbi:LRC25 protein, partial [Polypterus senegalus]
MESSALLDFLRNRKAKEAIISKIVVDNDMVDQLLLFLLLLNISTTLVVGCSIGPSYIKKSESNYSYLNMDMIENSRCLYVENRTISFITGYGDRVAQLVDINLAYNLLTSLPEQFLKNATSLLALNLSHNNLTKLPSDFLAQSNNLEILNLEGNQLSTLPLTILHDTLKNLTTDCSCQFESLLSKIPSNVSFTCYSGLERQNMASFAAQTCSSGLMTGLAVGLSVSALVIVLIVAGLMYFFRSRSSNLTCQEVNKTAKRQSTLKTCQPEDEKKKLHYENVQLGAAPSHEQSLRYEPLSFCKLPQVTSLPHSDGEDGCYMQYDPSDEAIYNNDPSFYPEYHNPLQDDDVYIMPDEEVL